MPVGVKLLFSVIVLAVAIGFAFINPRANNAGPNWLWRGGRRDLMRTVLFREDGSFRKHTKLGTMLFFAGFLALIWLAIPEVP
jgi:hypothetical protein